MHADAKPNLADPIQATRCAASAVAARNCSRISPREIDGSQPHDGAAAIAANMSAEQLRLRCGSEPPSYAPSEKLDSCIQYRQAICQARHKRDLHQCSYARDTARLARWVEDNRRQLPRHVFYMDPRAPRGRRALAEHVPHPRIRGSWPCVRGVRECA